MSNDENVPVASCGKKIRLDNNFSELTVEKLKYELLRRGAKTTGRKAELIERLEAYERNQDFCSTVILTPEENQMPAWPDKCFFHSITSSHRNEIPKIEQSQINQYVLYRQCNDNSENQDISAIKKGKN